MMPRFDQKSRKGHVRKLCTMTTGNVFLWPIVAVGLAPILMTRECQAFLGQNGFPPRNYRPGMTTTTTDCLKQNHHQCSTRVVTRAATEKETRKLKRYIKMSVVDDTSNREAEDSIFFDDEHRYNGTLPYFSYLFETKDEWETYLQGLAEEDNYLWEQIKLEALSSLGPEPEAGPQLYMGILSQPNLVEALVTICAQEIATELIPATALKALFLKMLTSEDREIIQANVIAAATRSPSVGNALSAILFHMGLHALVCQRVGHKLWLANRQGLAYYLQSTVSQRYSADIHPAAQLGSGMYLCSSAGVVIGETVITGDNVSIMHGVTLGGTGKERGDRHPKVGNGVILEDGATVLGNIKVGDGALITAKSIVTKPVPPLAIMSGVPARVQGYRELTREAFMGHDIDRHLAFHYLEEWKLLPKPTTITTT
jgi:serine O-acetyltransferase